MYHIFIFVIGKRTLIQNYHIHHSKYLNWKNFIDTQETYQNLLQLLAPSKDDFLFCKSFCYMIFCKSHRSISSTFSVFCDYLLLFIVILILISPMFIYNWVIISYFMEDDKRFFEHLWSFLFFADYIYETCVFCKWLEIIKHNNVFESSYIGVWISNLYFLFKWVDFFQFVFYIKRQHHQKQQKTKVTSNLHWQECICVLIHVCALIQHAFQLLSPPTPPTKITEEEERGEEERGEEV